MANVFNLSGTAHEISRVKPDIVTLQEVDNRTQRHPVDEVAFLSAHAHMPYYAFAPWRPFEGGQYGIALLSRYPLLEVRKHGYVKPGASSHSNEPKCLVQKPMDFCQGILAAKIALPSFPDGVWIVNTHISADGAQFEEAKQLVAYVTQLLQETGVKHAMIAGDFNEAPTGQGPSYVAKYWHDSISCFNQPSNPNAYTFSSAKPDRRIDYIWTTGPDLEHCQRTWTVNTQASDHFPFIGDW